MDPASHGHRAVPTMHTLTMEQRWTLAGQMMGNFAIWFFGAWTFADTDAIVKIGVGLTAIVAGVFTIMSARSTIKKNKIDIELGRRKLSVKVREGDTTLPP